MFPEAFELLAAGRFAEGFARYSAWQETPEYAVRSARLPPLGLFSPRWKGQNLAGKTLLIISEQGLGDQVMYARFAPLLQKLGADVSWLCPGTLRRLFSECLGVRAIAAEGRIELIRPDFHIFSSGLPARFFPPLAMPPAPPCLSRPAPDVRPGMRVGIAPSGNPKHPNDANRSLTEAAFDRLLQMPGAMSLLPQHTGAADFYDTARIIAGLDLVVGVDSAVCHVAASMGTPTWVLLPHIGLDWRWGGGVQSPWYPEARLFRQRTAGDWHGVIDEVVLAAHECHDAQSGPARESGSSRHV